MARFEQRFAKVLPASVEGLKMEIKEARADITTLKMKISRAEKSENSGSSLAVEKDHLLKERQELIDREVQLLK